MNCPSCTSPATKEQRKKTTLGYRTFRCADCRRSFNERPDTPFNFLEYLTDIVLLVVFWRRYKLSLRDLAEMFLERGFVFTHEAVHDWAARFAPVIADQLRMKQRGQAGTSWHIDQTSRQACKESGATCIVPSRAMATWLPRCSRERRDMEAAKQFLTQAVEVVGHPPERVTTDGHDSSPRAIRETIGNEVIHRCSHSLNNRLEPGSSQHQAALLSDA